MRCHNYCVMTLKATLTNRVEKWKLSVSGELKYQSKFLNVDGSIRVSSLMFSVPRFWHQGPPPPLNNDAAYVLNKRHHQ